MKKICLLLIFTLFSSLFCLAEDLYALEHDNFKVSSFKSVFKVDDVSYVAANTQSITNYENDLIRLWHTLPNTNHADGFWSEWKTVPLDELIKIIPDLDTHYLVVAPDIEKILPYDENCPMSRKNCHGKINDTKIVRVKVTEAILYKWNSPVDVITPVLKLDTHQLLEETPEWHAVALGAKESFPATIFSKLNHSRIKSRFTKKLRDGFQGLDIRIGNTHRYSILTSGDGLSLNPYFWLIDHWEKSEKKYLSETTNPESDC